MALIVLWKNGIGFNLIPIACKNKGIDNYYFSEKAIIGGINGASQDSLFRDLYIR